MINKILSKSQFIILFVIFVLSGFLFVKTAQAVCTSASCPSPNMCVDGECWPGVGDPNPPFNPIPITAVCGNTLCEVGEKGVCPADCPPGTGGGGLGGSGGGGSKCFPPVLDPGGIAPFPGGLLPGINQISTSFSSAISNFQLLRTSRTSQPTFGNLNTIFVSPTIVSGKTVVSSSIPTSNRGLLPFFGSIDTLTKFSTVFNNAILSLPSNVKSLTITNGVTQFQYYPGVSNGKGGTTPGVFKQLPCDGAN